VKCPKSADAGEEESEQEAEGTNVGDGNEDLGKEMRDEVIVEL
jgi:hypothetical protein